MDETYGSKTEHGADETDLHIGQSVLTAIEHTELLHGYIDPDNPVYDQN